MINTTITKVLIIVVTSVIGMIGIASSVIGYFMTNLGWIERVALFIGGLLMIDTSIQTDIIGISLLVAIGLAQFIKCKKKNKEQETGIKP